MNLTNHQFRLAARPVGLPKRSDWNYVEEPVRDPGPGEVLVKTLYLSLDPAMRGWMNEGRSYIAPVGIGDVMRAGGAGKVIASANPGFGVGDYVTGVLGAQEYALISAEGTRGLVKVDPKLVPLPVYVGALGLTGLTAYFGLLEVGQAKAGDTVVVSGAAGATGMVAGQIAKIKGCRAVGIAGGAEKCDYIVKELGFDAAIDYKNENVLESLRKHCPKGVNVYFDNVGGDILEQVLARLAFGGRIVLCGAISQYNQMGGVMAGPRNYMQLIVRAGRMEGFLVFQFAERYPEAIAQLSKWVAEGKVKNKLDLQRGLENAPKTIIRLFTGANFGKQLLTLANAA